ncbi:MAG TPA: nitroreductase, partial [Deltaproteobacteria bacterium]|nr:nitroreductase [Deltaproteobacteria bacterium]
EPSKAWVRKADGRNYAWVDVTIAVTEMIGAATAEGLGTCWVAAIEPEKVKEILGIPDGIDVVAIIVIGYPVEELKVEEKSRKPLSEIIHWGRW